MVVNGVVCKEPTTVKHGVWNHYKSVFLEPWKIRPKMGGVFQTLVGSQASNLVKEFTKSEVWCALKNCDGNTQCGSFITSL